MTTTPGWDHETNRSLAALHVIAEFLTMDTHDTSFDAIRAILLETSLIQQQLAVQQAKTDAMLQELITSLVAKSGKARSGKARKLEDKK
jgi:hypothetical protein